MLSSASGTNTGPQKTPFKPKPASDHLWYQRADPCQLRHLDWQQKAQLVLINRRRAMMHHANIPKDIRYKVFPKLFETATLLDSLAGCMYDWRGDQNPSRTFWEYNIKVCETFKNMGWSRYSDDLVQNATKTWRSRNYLCVCWVCSESWRRLLPKVEPNKNNEGVHNKKYHMAESILLYQSSARCWWWRSAPDCGFW